jgi:hypothetical protein
VLLYQGGGPFLVPDATQLAHFGGSGAVRAVPDGSLQAFMGPPIDGTLLREFSSSQVFRIVNGLPTVTTLPSDVDVRVVPDGAIAGSLLDRITFSVPRLTIGRSATATVWLKAPFTGDLVANLSFTPAGFASIPATVTIPKHTLSASFTISTPSVVLPASPMSIAVAATIGGVMASASLPLQIPRLVRFDVAPSIITAGAKGATGTIALEVPYAADLVVSLHSYSPTFATVPPTVTIPKGQTSASFNIVAPASQAAFALFTVSLQAAVADTSVNATIQVRSSVVQGTLKTISLSAPSIQAGGSVTLTATLDAVVPTATDVFLAAQTPGGMTTSPYIASINPSTIHVAAGQTQGTATIVTKSSASGHSVHIMATAVSIKYATLTIT